MTKSGSKQISGLRYLSICFLTILAVFSLARAGLFFSYWSRMSEYGSSSGLAFVYGLRNDLMAACMLFVIPTIALLLIPNQLQKAKDIFIKAYILILFVIAIFMEISSIPFLEEFDSRPNDLFINYLAYPQEVSSMLIKDHWGNLLVILLLSTLIPYFYIRFTKTLTLTVPRSWLQRIAICLVLLVLQFVGIRSSVGHRPANLSDIAFSNSHIVNEVTKNAIYTLGFTIYSRSKHSTDIDVYGVMTPETALNRVKSRLTISGCSDDVPFLRTELSNFNHTKKKNLVVILMESLGSQFVESFGGEKGLTPNIDRMSKESYAFQNLYATGIRSVRGMEAVVAGFLPVPGESVVKRGKAQDGFFTIAQLLKPLGYESSFIYGGEKRFDNMGHWYQGNGFDLVIDENDFEDPIFHGTWGVCDEDLFKKAHQHFESLQTRNQPFVSVVFTTSFHTPFEFPEGRIADNDLSDSQRTVQYADYALGGFFDQAKSSSYYEDTVFLVIADHDYRVAGRDLVPIERFKIPGFIIAQGLAPQRDERLASQPDAIATSLDLLGLHLDHPILGRSVFTAQNDIAFMQYHDAYALMTSDQVAMVLPDGLPQTFSRTVDGLFPTAQNLELENDLLAFIHTSSYLYENRLHRLAQTTIKQ